MRNKYDRLNTPARRPQMNPQYPCQQQQQQQQYVNSPLSPVQCGTNQAQVTENGSELNCMFDDFFRQSDALFQRCLATDATSPNSQTSELIAIHSPASTPASPNRNLLKSPLIPKVIEKLSDSLRLSSAWQLSPLAFFRVISVDKHI